MQPSEDRVIVEDGVIAGNFYDKYSSSNPIARLLMRKFFASVEELVTLTGAHVIHEVGCGEGHLLRHLAKAGYEVRGSDFSQAVIAKAEAFAQSEGVDAAFKACSIYDMLPERDAAELVVCCEVLEHLESPQKALEILAGLAAPYLLVSVPREPLWRIMNLARLKYVAQLGNTPGHIQHWSRQSFISFLSGTFDIVRVETPTPWIVVLCRAKKSN